jgi:hypothetical protein
MSRIKALHEYAVDVTSAGRIETYTVIANSTIHARDLTVHHLGTSQKWDRIQARHVQSVSADEEARVVT